MDQALFMDCVQSRHNLRDDFQCQFGVETGRTLDEAPKSLSLDKLHCIEIVFLTCPGLEDGGDIWMADTGGSSGFPQKSGSDGFIRKVTRADNLKSSEPS